MFPAVAMWSGNLEPRQEYGLSEGVESLWPLSAWDWVLAHPWAQMEDRTAQMESPGMGGYNLTTVSVDLGKVCLPLAPEENEAC